MNEHVIDEPLHAVPAQRLVMLERRHAARLALLIGKRAHEQRRGMRIADSIDNARHKQIGKNRREKRARSKHDEVGFANRVKRGRVRANRRSRFQPYAIQRRIGMARLCLAIKLAPVPRCGTQAHFIERRRIDMPPRVQQSRANIDGLGK